MFSCPVCGARPLERSSLVFRLPQCEHVLFGDSRVGAFAWLLVGGVRNSGRYAALIKRLLELGLDLNTVTRDVVRAVALTLEK